jgi:hypothetical protein
MTDCHFYVVAGPEVSSTSNIAQLKEDVLSPVFAKAKWKLKVRDDDEDDEDD